MSLIVNLVESFQKWNLEVAPTSLCKLMKKYGSDKSTWHNFSTLYSFLFDQYAYEVYPTRLLEMGIGSTNPNIASNMGPDGVPGASLRAFERYLPAGEIFGADIDEMVLFQEGRIRTHQCDQTSPASIKALWDWIGDPVHVIIDDGLHQAYANIPFLENSWEHLKKDGLYFIEDVHPGSIDEISKFLETFECSYKKILTIPHDQNKWDNMIAILQK